MNWKGVIVAYVRGFGKFEGRGIYLIQCDDATAFGDLRMR